MAVFFRVSFGDCLCFMTVAETNDEKGKGAPLKKQGRTDQKIHNSRQLIRIQIFCFHSCSFDRGCLLSLESFIKEAMILKRAVVRRQDCLFSVFRRQHLSHLREKRGTAGNFKAPQANDACISRSDENSRKAEEGFERNVKYHGTDYCLAGREVRTDFWLVLREEKKDAEEKRKRLDSCL